MVTTIENIAAHSIVGPGITVLADLPREELLHDYLPHIDVLVSPTSSDCGAPYAILEALQSGACVVLLKNARPLWHKAFSMTALHSDLLAAYAAVAPMHPVGVAKTTSAMSQVGSRP